MMTSTFVRTVNNTYYLPIYAIHKFKAYNVPKQLIKFHSSAVNSKFENVRALSIPERSGSSRLHFPAIKLLQNTA